MNGCHGHCHACPAHLGRRHFLKDVSAVAALGASAFVTRAEDTASSRPRVAVFFLSDPKPVENWPWPGWNPEPREKELSDLLVRGCPDVDFEFFSSHRKTVQAGLKAKSRFDGVLAYVMTLGRSGTAIMPLVEWKKPMVLANYVLGGCAPWLTTTTKLFAQKRPWWPWRAVSHAQRA